MIIELIIKSPKTHKKKKNKKIWTLKRHKLFAPKYIFKQKINKKKKMEKKKPEKFYLKGFTSLVSLLLSLSCKNNYKSFQFSILILISINRERRNYENK